jgi:hypothetical protein
MKRFACFVLDIDSISIFLRCRFQKSSFDPTDTLAISSIIKMARRNRKPNTFRQFSSRCFHKTKIAENTIDIDYPGTCYQVTGQYFVLVFEINIYSKEVLTQAPVDPYQVMA